MTEGPVDLRSMANGSLLFVARTPDCTATSVRASAPLSQIAAHAAIHELEATLNSVSSFRRRIDENNEYEATNA